VFEKLVMVTRKTRLEELVERFNTREQARFYIEHMGLDFADYDVEHANYQRAVETLRRTLDGLLSKMQVIDRQFLPNFLFSPKDLVVTVGQDGIVVNTAKYLDGQPIVAVNPDPARFDGILLPFSPAAAATGVIHAAEGAAAVHRITMAEATFNDGQRLLAFNDFYVGQRTHVSSRYTLGFEGQRERQSSSGVLVATGAGSTGWFSSTQNMADAVTHMLLGEKAPAVPRMRFGWDDPRLAFVVREPFRSKWSGVTLGAGLIDPGESLAIESHMPESGVVFSDGVEADAIDFNSGSVVDIHASKRHTILVAAIPEGSRLRAAPPKWLARSSVLP